MCLEFIECNQDGMCDRLKSKRKTIVTFTCYGFCNCILILKYENVNMFDLQPLANGIFPDLIQHPKLLVDLELPTIDPHPLDGLGYAYLRTHLHVPTILAM